MIWLAIALSLTPAAPPPPAPPWRVLSAPGVHLGVRPALSITPSDVAAGVTVQLSLCVL